MITTFRRALAVALVAGLTLMNVQGAELHVHSAVGDDAHQHGPASHHHDVDRDASETTQLAAVDADDTVVHVSLVAAAAHQLKLLEVARQIAVLCGGGLPTVTDAARIIARAHGPPSTVQHSLRAPPYFPSL